MFMKVAILESFCKWQLLLDVVHQKNCLYFVHRYVVGVGILVLI